MMPSVFAGDGATVLGASVSPADSTTVLGGTATGGTATGGEVSGSGTVAATAGETSATVPPGLEKGLTPVFNGSGLEQGISSASIGINGVYKERSLVKLIAGWVRFFLPIIAFAAFVAIIISGWFFVTSGGDDGRHDAAKKTLIWAVIGLIVVMGAYALVNTFLFGLTTFE